ncbi:MAG: hypothetical protein JEY91_03780 [Spirochaetaceae bacterium]|nr:hypothetical protein [Spirochaetaceae bacterium]
MEKSRRQILIALGASHKTIEELLVYNKRNFARIDLQSLPNLPLEDELQMSVWDEYTAEAQKNGTFSSLKKRLPQLNFPIREKISTLEYYRSATLKGTPVQDIPEAIGLILEDPDKLQLSMHESQAGKIPVIIAENRNDFISLVQALSAKNEPLEIPDSMGAIMIAGLNNWDRINCLKSVWMNNNPNDFMGLKWDAEFKRIIADKRLYQDRFIILSSSPYSGVAPSELQLSEKKWAELSLIIRREHECTHYFTKRILGSMENHLHDEIIADYMGITAAIGHFRSDWFLRFLGLENFPEYRNGGRLENYCLNAKLSEDAYALLQTIAVKAAQNLEIIDKRCRKNLNTPYARSMMVILLTQYSIEELSCEDVVDLISEDFYQFTG